MKYSSLKSIEIILSLPGNIMGIFCESFPVNWMCCLEKFFLHFTNQSHYKDKPPITIISIEGLKVSELSIVTVQWAHKQGTHNKIKQLFDVCLFGRYFYSTYWLTQLCSICFVGIHNMCFRTRNNHRISKAFCNGSFRSTFLRKFLLFVHC